MIKVINSLEKYYRLFESYEVFENYLKYTIRDNKPEIFVDDENNTKCVVLYSNPAYFILGNPDEINTKEVFSLFHNNSWIIASSYAWKAEIINYFNEKVVVHKRTLFDSDSLDVNHILNKKSAVPKGFTIVPISEKHIEEGMIYDDVLSRFFTVSDFLNNGYGFALIDEKNTCHGFALTNYPIIGNEVELYFRVGYDTCPELRLKGIGTTLCTYFIEESLNRGYTPTWDSANEISAHIAKKLGYVEKKEWFMYHIL